MSLPMTKSPSALGENNEKHLKETRGKERHKGAKIEITFVPLMYSQRPVLKLISDN